MKKYILFLLLFLFIPNLTLAATYYVKNGGNDSLEGTSDATAWETISKVNSFNFQPGDDVYFKCGSTWNITSSELNIDWSGVSTSNYSVIGAYYGSGTIGLSGAKPIFDGGDVNTTARLILANSQKYLRFENLRLINSSTTHACGLEINGDTNYSTSDEYIDVDGVETNNTANAGIIMRKVQYGNLTNCIVENHLNKLTSGTGMAFGVVDHCKNITIKHNTVKNGKGEGLGVYKWCENIVVEENTIYAQAIYHLYVDYSRHVIVRNNLIYGTTNSSWWSRITNAPGSGIVVANEAWPENFLEDVVIQDNLIAYANMGIEIGEKPASDPAFRDIKVFNNTIIDSVQRNIKLWTNYPTTTVYSGNEIKNNIFWCISDGCIQAMGVGIDFSDPGLVFANNFWSSQPISGVQSSTDPGYPNYNNGNPGITKTSWRNMVGGDLDGSEFAITEGSACVDSGATLASDYQSLLNLDQSDFQDFDFTYYDQGDYGVGWEIGADIYTTEEPADPPANPPTGLNCEANSAEKITCSWDSVENATWYRVFRDTSEPDINDEVTSGSSQTTTTYINQALTPNTTYHFKVTACNQDGCAVLSDETTENTNVFSWDLLSFNFITNGLDGWVNNSSGDATATQVAGGIRLYDADSTAIPDERARITQGIGSIPLTDSIKFKLTLDDVPATYSFSAPVRFVGIYWYNGTRAQIVRFMADGIRVRTSDGSTDLQADTSQYIDEGGSAHVYLLQDDNGTLTITRDDAQILQIEGAGSANSGGNGTIGLEANGTDTDPADATFEFIRVGSGVGDVSETIPVITAYSPQGNRAYGTTSELLSITLDTANATGCKWDDTAETAYADKDNTFSGSGTSYTYNYTELSAGTYDVCAQCTGAGGDGDEVCWQFTIPSEAPGGGTSTGISSPSGLRIN